MKKTIKHAVLRALKQTGAFRKIAESQWRQGKLLILCYHGISMEDEHEWRSDSYMSAADFEARLTFLRSGGYTVLPLEDALKKLYSNTLPPKSVVITFDDGMYNFYSQAFPLLQKYGYPSTLYLTTYYCCDNQPVFPLICSYMLWKKRAESFPANPALGFDRPPNLATTAGRHAAGVKLHAFAEKNHMTAAQKDDLARHLAGYLKLDYEALVSKRLMHLMTPEEVKDVSVKGVDIQLHTHRHRTPMDSVLFQKEISDNRVKIQEITGEQALHFCYPSGVHRPQFLPWLSEQGVSSATTCDHGLSDAKTNPLLLPRFLDSPNVSPIEFESWVIGVGSFFPRNPLRHWAPSWA